MSLYNKLDPNVNAMIQYVNRHNRQRMIFLTMMRQRQQRAIVAATNQKIVVLQTQTQTQLCNFKAAPGIKKALLIGINYNKTPYQLNGCINDASALANRLAFTYGFKNIFLLTDNTVIKPTRINILNNIKAFLQSAQDGDTLFLSYSGHGSYVLDRNGDETQDRRDEVLIGCDLQAVLDDDLKILLNTCLRPKVTLIVLCDSCFSESVLDLRYQHMDTQYKKDLNVNTTSTDTPGNVILLSGCQDNQYSEDAYINKTFQGAMTWAFLTQLTNTPRPTWKNLLVGMRAMMKSRGFTQIAQLSTGRLLNITTTTVAL